MPNYSLPPASLTAPLRKSHERLLTLLDNGCRLQQALSESTYELVQGKEHLRDVRVQTIRDMQELGLLDRALRVTEEAKERLNQRT